MEPTPAADPFTNHYRCAFVMRNDIQASAFICDGVRAMSELAKIDTALIDTALDELLVNLAPVIMRLSTPDLTKTPEARRALVHSVQQYAVCAAHSSDPRVHELSVQLEATLKPPLRVVASK
jgi:hypothetical protein